MSAVRVFVLAPSPMVRAGLRAMLAGGEPEVEVAGEAAAPADLTVTSSEADVVLLADEELLEEAARIVAEDGDGALVLLADDEGAIPLLMESALKGWGIVAPDAPPGELSAAVVAAGQGLVVLPKPLADRLLVGETAVPEAAAETLTARETEVLDLLSRGFPNKQIARQLGISEHTVKYHVSSVFTKLGTSSRAEAVGRGARLGLITL